MRSLPTRLLLVPVLWLLLLLPGLAQEASGAPGFVAVYADAEDPKYKLVQEAIQEAKLLETVAEFLNAVFVMPRQVTLIGGEAGQVNAFYSPEHHAVIISYELIMYFVELFQKVDPKDGHQYASGALLFVIFHEIGHCLIGELGLPTVGKEEDAVDEFATLLLLEFGEQGQMAILSAAAWFAHTGVEGDANLPFWDEHSLSQQRFYGIFTLLYATNPATYGEMAGQLGISERRLALAKDEYRKKDEAWSRLLQPHVRGQ